MSKERARTRARKRGPEPRPAAERKTRSTKLTEGDFDKVRELHFRFAEASGLPMSMFAASDILGIAVDLAHRVTGPGYAVFEVDKLAATIVRVVDHAIDERGIARSPDLLAAVEEAINREVPAAATIGGWPVKGRTH